jgi:hypothetical protein
MINRDLNQLNREELIQLVLEITELDIGNEMT